MNSLKFYPSTFRSSKSKLKESGGKIKKLREREKKVLQQPKKKEDEWSGGKKKDGEGLTFLGNKTRSNEMNWNEITHYRKFFM